MKQLIIVTILLVITADVYAAGFDCAKAVTPVEKMICSDNEISQLDELMLLSYKTALIKTSYSNSLKSEQKAWLSNVRNKCQERSCLTRVYKERIAVLNGIGPAEKTGVKNEEEILAEMWAKKRSNAPKEVRDLLNKWDELNEKCRGGSGDDPKTWKACDKRDELYPKITGSGWCMGNGGEDQFGYQKYWQHCNTGRGRSKK
jgi:uncharacterized protein